MLLTHIGCTALIGSWDYGLPNDAASTEDRLWHIIFPLSIAAADYCVFKREDTYGFFLIEPSKLPLEGSASAGGASALVRFVHARSPAGKAGMSIGDAIIAVNGDSVLSLSATQVVGMVNRLTRVKIQPLTLRLRRENVEWDINLWAVPSCRMNVKLVKSPVINALSDGPAILVTTGLLEFVRSPDQLAWVLAHEVGHHALEHAETVKLQMMLNRFLSSTVGEKPKQISQLDLERQADRFAADLMVRAGFDLREARRFIKWVQAHQVHQTENNLNRSHPTDEERLEAFDRMIEAIDRGAQPAIGP